MSDFTINGQWYEAVPLTVLTEALRHSLYLRLGEYLKASPDDLHRYMAENRGGLLWIYVTCASMLKTAPFQFPLLRDDVAHHADAFIRWCDTLRTHEADALYRELDAINAPPGDKRIAPPETLTPEKKVS